MNFLRRFSFWAAILLVVGWLPGLLIIAITRWKSFCDFFTGALVGLLVFLVGAAILAAFTKIPSGRGDV